MKNEKIISLDEQQKSEIEKLIKELQEHKNKYYMFDSFVKTCNDALSVAHALLNNDYKTFRKYALKYTTHTAQKMKGLQSLSTYKKTSNICNFLSQHDGICKKCYAEKSIKLYQSTLKPSLIYNTLLLKYVDIDNSQIPYINDRFFRFESFSDLQSAKHLHNLIKVCNKNKSTIFALWTKAGYTLKNMLNDEGIKKLPSNLNIIISEFYINKKTDRQYLENLQTVLYPSQAVTGKYTNCLKCFVVFDDENARKDSNMYLCKNKCIDCLKCYKKSKQIIYIAEKLH